MKQVRVIGRNNMRSMIKLDTQSAMIPQSIVTVFQEVMYTIISGLSAHGEKEEFIYTTPFPVG